MEGIGWRLGRRLKRRRDAGGSPGKREIAFPASVWNAVWTGR
jgi:hypothetical protein